MLSNVSFDGASGKVIFLGSGDRAPLTLAYVLENWVSDENGFLIAHPVTSFSLTDGITHAGGKTVWPGGGTVQPADLLWSPLDEGGGGVPSEVVVLLMIAVVLTSLVCLLLIQIQIRGRRTALQRVDPATKELLALFSNPQLTRQAQALGLRPLSLGQDIKHLMRSMNIGDVAIEPAATLLDAQEVLRKHLPRILVFSGHTFMGSLAFEDTNGRLDEHAGVEMFSRLLLGQVRGELQPVRGSAMALERLGSRAMLLRGESRGPGQLDIGAQLAALRHRHDSISELTSKADAVDYLTRLSQNGLSIHPLPFSLDDELVEGRPWRMRVGNAVARLGQLHSALPSALLSPRLPLSTSLSKISGKSEGEGGKHGWGGGETIPYSLRRRGPRLLSESTNQATEATLIDARLEIVLLNGCKTEEIAHHLLSVAPDLAVICWPTLAEDSAARAFSAGFYESVHRMLVFQRQLRVGCWPMCSARGGARMVVGEAFRAGCESFLKQGFAFGDPEAHLHPAGHPHQHRPDFANCTSCTPPVHGDCLLLQSVGGETVSMRGSELFAPEPSRNAFSPVAVAKDLTQRLRGTSVGRRSILSVKTGKLQGIQSCPLASQNL